MQTFKCSTKVLVFLTLAIAFAGLGRLWHAGTDLFGGDATALLTIPLGVIIPVLIFAYLVRFNAFASAEGALMQLGTLIQLLLIVSLPALALYFALGLPVVFLAVELFETRLPKHLRDPIRSRLLA